METLTFLTCLWGNPSCLKQWRWVVHLQVWRRSQSLTILYWLCLNRRTLSSHSQPSLQQSRRCLCSQFLPANETLVWMQCFYSADISVPPTKQPSHLLKKLAVSKDQTFNWQIISTYHEGNLQQGRQFVLIFHWCFRMYQTSLIAQRTITSHQHVVSYRLSEDFHFQDIGQDLFSFLQREDHKLFVRYFVASLWALWTVTQRTPFESFVQEIIPFVLHRNLEKLFAGSPMVKFCSDRVFLLSSRILWCDYQRIPPTFKIVKSCILQLCCLDMVFACWAARVRVWNPCIYGNLRRVTPRSHHSIPEVLVRLSFRLSSKGETYPVKVGMHQSYVVIGRNNVPQGRKPLFHSLDFDRVWQGVSYVLQLLISRRVGNQQTVSVACKNVEQVTRNFPNQLWTQACPECWGRTCQEIPSERGPTGTQKSGWAIPPHTYLQAGAGNQPWFRSALPPWTLLSFGQTKPPTFPRILWSEIGLRPCAFFQLPMHNTDSSNKKATPKKRVVHRNVRNPSNMVKFCQNHF